MEYRLLGRSGLRVSALSFGSWVTFGGQVGEDAASACMKAAYDFGVNYFDCAEEYAAGKAETVLGNIIRKMGWKRSDLVLSTKIFWGGKGPNDMGLSRKHLIEGTEASLARMRVDYVDLLFCHRPDRDTPIAETVRAMSHLVDRGRAFYWGTSEWDAREIAEAYHIAQEEHLVPPTMEQPEYNMFHRERVEKEYAPLYEAFGLGTTIWSPLASGFLTGKYNAGIPAGTRLSLKGYGWLRKRLEGPEGEEKIAKVKKLGRLAAETGDDPAPDGPRLVPEEPLREHGHHGRLEAPTGGREHEIVGRRPLAHARSHGAYREGPGEQALAPRRRPKRIAAALAAAVPA